MVVAAAEGSCGGSGCVERKGTSADAAATVKCKLKQTSRSSVQTLCAAPASSSINCSVLNFTGDSKEGARAVKMSSKNDVLDSVTSVMQFQQRNENFRSAATPTAASKNEKNGIGYSSPATFNGRSATDVSHLFGSVCSKTVVPAHCEKAKKSVCNNWRRETIGCVPSSQCMSKEAKASLPPRSLTVDAPMSRGRGANASVEVSLNRSAELRVADCWGDNAQPLGYFRRHTSVGVKNAGFTRILSAIDNYATQNKSLKRGRVRRLFARQSTMTYAHQPRDGATDCPRSSCAADRFGVSRVTSLEQSNLVTAVAQNSKKQKAAPAENQMPNLWSVTPVMKVPLDQVPSVLSKVKNALRPWFSCQDASLQQRTSKVSRPSLVKCNGGPEEVHTERVRLNSCASTGACSRVSSCASLRRVARPCGSRSVMRRCGADSKRTINNNRPETTPAGASPHSEGKKAHVTKPTTKLRNNKPKSGTKKCPSSRTQRVRGPDNATQSHGESFISRSSVRCVADMPDTVRVKRNASSRETNAHMKGLFTSASNNAFGRKATSTPKMENSPFRTVHRVFMSAGGPMPVAPLTLQATSSGLGRSPNLLKNPGPQITRAAQELSAERNAHKCSTGPRDSTNLKSIRRTFSVAVFKKMPTHKGFEEPQRLQRKETQPPPTTKTMANQKKMRAPDHSASQRRPRPHNAWSEKRGLSSVRRRRGRREGTDGERRVNPLSFGRDFSSLCRSFPKRRLSRSFSRAATVTVDACPSSLERCSPELTRIYKNNTTVEFERSPPVLNSLQRGDTYVDEMASVGRSECTSPSIRLPSESFSVDNHDDMVFPSTMRTTGLHLQSMHASPEFRNQFSRSTYFERSASPPTKLGGASRAGYSTEQASAEKAKGTQPPLMTFCRTCCDSRMPEASMLTK
ncbi:hypothetical protein ERJ75_000418600 [Trypanosoma vivax]|uniref:Uncharacterized protein n=1 Tax=Trypanosoma vivax (strain Y486) TaxID=1055687 RepID=F9WNY3_TRYVY|nr:hypothetical protein TRVL_07843 [Trypanosoma vivax]KAH8616907.1 hypothetical protein ERJ75_000418600 [Trypanosoma vivax]CCD19255.1 hypothetical protein, conserved [Trypanosoma vivax Y486]|eukprot:CCD19255.1 hypothetical protein, conserved [Trypanosoma vivax Y486]